MATGANIFCTASGMPFFHPLSQDYTGACFCTVFMLMSAIIKTCSTRNNKKNKTKKTERELETAFGGGLEAARGGGSEGRM